MTTSELRLPSIRTRDWTEDVRGVVLPLALASSAFASPLRGDYAYFRDARVLVIDDVLTGAHVPSLLPVLEAVARDRVALVLAARDFDPEVLAMLAINHTRGTMNVVPLAGDDVAALAFAAKAPAVRRADAPLSLDGAGHAAGIYATVDEALVVGDMRGAVDVRVVHVGGRDLDDARRRARALA